MLGLVEVSRVIILAEPGCTHEGSLDVLLKLLHTAADCGASCFKPQWVSDAVQMCERRHIGPDHPKRAYYEQAYRWNQFPIEWHAQLRQACTQRGMQYACTVFLPQDVAMIAPFVDYLKISSFEHQDDAMYFASEVSMKPTIASTGVTDGDPMRWPHVRWLHCVSAYPTPVDELNLMVLWPDDDLGDMYSGFSDHSRNVLTGAVAVGAGAQILETHFRLLDCDPNNPDYAVAFTPHEFALYIQNVRTAERMMGDGVKKIQPSEQWAIPYKVGVTSKEATG